MSLNKRFRLPKITITIFTVILVTILICIAIIHPDCESRYFHNSYYIIFGLIGLAIQLSLNRLNWKSDNKILILATLFFSAILLAAMLLEFFGMLKQCA